MRHPKAEEWEARLQEALDKVDTALEAEYGDRYPLHPARLPHGQAASRKYDGLFQLGASFSAGFGSKLGPGYILDVRMVTLSRVPEAERDAIVAQAIEMLRAELATAFPDTSLSIDRDGSVYKLHGDLSLD